MTRPPCAVPGCGRPHYGHGFCRAHHGRWRRHGDPRADLPIAAPATAEACSAFGRLTGACGRPAEPPPGIGAAGCGGPAAVWCYDGGDPAERVDPRGRRYSLDPARYRPSCRFCLRQAAVDRRAAFPRPRRRPALDVERAARLYRGGASSRGLAALMGVQRDAVCGRCAPTASRSAPRSGAPLDRHLPTRRDDEDQPDMTITNTIESTTTQHHTTTPDDHSASTRTTTTNDPYQDQNDTTQPEQERQCSTRAS